MTDLHNAFKHALHAGRPQIGLWLALADGHSAELLAHAGYDWLLIDGEHAPNDLRSTLAQLRAIAAAAPAGPVRSQPVVRLVEGDTALIKQVLELGAQTLLVPMVETPAQAAHTVAATRYPPRGVRGVGSGLARSSRWNQVPDYLQRAGDALCVLVQVESAGALRQAAAIAAVDGVDGVFFGPADLAASMGHLGQPAHPEVLAALSAGIAAVRAAGKPAGILATDAALARRWLAEGALFVAIGVDTTLLMQGAKALLAPFRAGG